METRRLFPHDRMAGVSAVFPFSLLFTYVKLWFCTGQRYITVISAPFRISDSSKHSANTNERRHHGKQRRPTASASIGCQRRLYRQVVDGRRFGLWKDVLSVTV
jgi:hypothetical protein